MGKRFAALRRHARLCVQIAAAALTNGYLLGFIKGRIYTGRLKQLCVPGLNCYSCPGALGSCPIGALQAVLGDRKYKFAFYVVGFLLMVGAVCGRFVCGWLCPFGLMQDLLHKIPFPKKWRKLPGDRWLKCLKYVLLAGFVILLPLFAVDIVGQGSPWFCKLVCPAGTLEGRPPAPAAQRTPAPRRGLALCLEVRAAAPAGAAVGGRLPALLPVSLPARRDLWIL